MKRRTFVAAIISGPEWGQQERTYAWNSAIRKTEDMIRAIARGEGQTYTAQDNGDVSFGKPGDAKAVYCRAWRGDRTGRLIIASVCAADE